MPKHLIAIFIVLLLSYVSAEAQSSLLVPKEHEGYEVRDGKIYFRQGNAGLILEAANDETIARYYSERGIELGNPFPTLHPQLQNATIFLLSLINHTRGNVTFTPNYALLKVKSETYFPVDFLLLQTMLDEVSSHHKQVFRESIFHSPETVLAGKVSSKFLLFPHISPKASNLELEFSYVYFEDRELTLKFYFERKKAPIFRNY